LEVSLNSDDLLNYTPLPSITAEDERILCRNSQYLTGEHDRLIHNYSDKQVAYDTSDLNKIIEAGNKKTNLKEVHLLTYLIKAITFESAVIPRKSFFIDYNDNFDFDDHYSIRREDCKDLKNFVLMSKPSQSDIDRYLALKDEENNISLLKDVFTPEFFKIISDIHGNYIYIKNLCWPGSVSYVKPGTNINGFIYFGYGLKNKDIDFLLC